MRPAEVLETAYEVFREEGFYHSGLVERYGLAPAGCSFHLLTLERQCPPRRTGDVVAAGVAIELDGELRVRPFLRRLVCLNGLVGIEVASGEAGGERIDPAERVRAALRHSVGAFLEGFLRSDDLPVRDPLDAAGPALRNRRLSREARDRLRRGLEALAEHPPVSAWEVVNLVTALHRWVPERTLDLEALGGRILAASTREVCPTCGQPS